MEPPITVAAKVHAMQLIHHAEKPRLSLVIDPRFSGGTSSAVARELYALAGHVSLRVYALETAMFRGRSVNPVLQSALDTLGLELEWNPKVIQSTFVAFHNPSCLKFNRELDLKIICDSAYVVTHENFLRPDGTLGFDVDLCLGLLDKALLCRHQILAPVSQYNAAVIENWMLHHPAVSHPWQLAELHWFNICDFTARAPNPSPQDHRGRHSRAGFEKFPPLDVMYRHFPAHAKRCTILGGDSLLLDRESIPDHWTVIPFGTMPVDAFLNEIDFFIYFTHPQLRESFGRVIAEAIAAGKVVITDCGTAATFGAAVIGSDGSDIDDIITNFIEHPAEYENFVAKAQESLVRFQPATFIEQILREFQIRKATAHDFF